MSKHSSAQLETQFTDINISKMRSKIQAIQQFLSSKFYGSNTMGTRQIRQSSKKLPAQTMYVSNICVSMKHECW